MTMNYNPPNLIGAQSAHVGTNPFLDRFSAARAAGSIIQYEYKNIKPKKQLKEITKVLMPEKKRFLKNWNILKGLTQHAQWILNKIENSFNRTFIGQKSMHQGFRKYFV